jgi:hypothetical protein
LQVRMPVEVARTGGPVGSSKEPPSASPVLIQASLW